MLEVGQKFLQASVNEAEDGDVGRSTVTTEGHNFQVLKEPRRRRYLPIFRELDICRRVYARREGQKIERVPLDDQLGLSAGESLVRTGGLAAADLRERIVRGVDRIAA